MTNLCKNIKNEIYEDYCYIMDTFLEFFDDVNDGSNIDERNKYQKNENKQISSTSNNYESVSATSFEIDGNESESETLQNNLFSIKRRKSFNNNN